ncbi:hypothetical protein [Muricoccus aerilatus]|uniref:hypothetical protein n=1 Tax=Muricoccus aerilatus TaxID=452982 RepID=UPI0012EC009D|nr:hypothetical protein [Roseomonas aerilata]
MSWPLVLAAAGALVGIGRFLDEFFVSKDHRNKVTLQLIRFFCWLDETTIPNIPGSILAWSTISEFKLTLQNVLWHYMAVFTSTFFVSFGGAFFFGYNVQHPDAIPAFAIFSIVMSAFTSAMLLGPSRSLVQIQQRRTGRVPSFLASIGAAFFIFITSVLAFYVVENLHEFLAAPDDPPADLPEDHRAYLKDREESTSLIIFAIFIAPFIPGLSFPAVAAIVILSLVVTKALADVVRRFLMTSANVATKAEVKSPYAYLFGFLSVLLLIGKLADEILRVLI